MDLGIGDTGVSAVYGEAASIGSFGTRDNKIWF